MKLAEIKGFAADMLPHFGSKWAELWTKVRAKESDWRIRQQELYLFKDSSLLDTEHPKEKRKVSQTGKQVLQRKMGTKGKVRK